MLASLPVRLDPGEPAALPSVSRSARRGLSLAWLALGLAAAALSALALGAVTLAGRKATFASAVTHELRTPLTTFRVYAEMLEGGLVPEGQVPAYLATLRSEADRLSHLVENVLAWSRLERGRFGRLRERVEVDALLAREVPRLEERAASAGMTLTVDAGTGAPADGALAVQGEATAVGQILFNLVDNACKHAAAAAERRITLTVCAEPGAVRLSVRDRGPGIPKRSARRLFRAFGRPAAEAALSAPGVGLGLPLSRRLARAMGGSLVLARAEPGEAGATFVLRLPRV
jgi:signal transduction histidine kinase